jgi:rhodanese-related sulfurtransferase
LNLSTTLLLIVLLVIAVYFFSFRNQGKGEDDVTTNEVQEMIANKDSLVLLDVRTPQEYISEEGHIPGSILIPLGELKSRTHELEKYKDKELIVICSSGVRSASATRYLRKIGFDAFNMEGGMRAWNKLNVNTNSDSTEKIYEKTVE